jgi:hypothetical protein
MNNLAKIMILILVLGPMKFLFDHQEIFIYCQYHKIHKEIVLNNPDVCKEYFSAFSNTIIESILDSAYDLFADETTLHLNVSTNFEKIKVNIKLIKIAIFLLYFIVVALIATNTQPIFVNVITFICKKAIFVIYIYLIVELWFNFFTSYKFSLMPYAKYGFAQMLFFALDQRMNLINYFI